MNMSWLAKRQEWARGYEVRSEFGLSDCPTQSVFDCLYRVEGIDDQEFWLRVELRSMSASAFSKDPLNSPVKIRLGIEQ